MPDSTNLVGLTLPVREPEVYDSSTLSTLERCPRKGFYQYGLHRAPSGINYPIQFGQAYHKFREWLENLHKKLIVEDELDLEDAKTQKLIYGLSFQKALEVTWVYEEEEKVLGWDEPPIEHKHSFLTKARLDSTCNKAFESWLEEKRDGLVKVLLWEQSFDLPFPSGERYGGRFDQLIEWNKKLWLRDFKTTSRMGAGYGAKFDPDNQMSGYVWATQVLSNTEIEGVMIDVVYNTKKIGPEFHPYLTTRTPWQIEDWVADAEYEIQTAHGYFKDGRFPKRTSSCEDYGGCFFRDACRRDGWGNIERWLKVKTIKNVWDFADPNKEEGVVD